MNALQIFQHEKFGKIRTLGDWENPLFCLADVCRALELNPSKVAQRLEKGVLSKYPLQTAGGVQEMNFVNEDGLYDVILDSRKPEAKKFRKWITNEVLPSIRKTGMYALPNLNVSVEWLIARQRGKDVRKKETSYIQKFIDYARHQGSQRPDKAYYAHFSKIANLAAGLPAKKGRDKATPSQLDDLRWIENVLAKFLDNEMTIGKNYKEILEDTNIWLEEFLRITYIQPNLLT